MTAFVGVLASVLLIEAERIWVRFADGKIGVLASASGPEVRVGAVLLVQNDASFVHVPAELFPRDAEVGSLATVESMPPGDLIWVRYSGGGYGPLHRSAGPEVEVGALILVVSGNFTKAPDGLLPPPQQTIGVVRRVDESRSLVELDHSIKWVPHAGPTDWDEWSTVQINESGIVKQLSQQPIRYGDPVPARSMVHSRFRVDPKTITDTFEKIKGLEPQIRELREIIALMHDAESLRARGLLPIRGVLLAGESGTGKTMLARALAKEADAEFFHVRGPEISSKWVNESEEMLRALMDEADSLDRAVVFFDEIDSLGGARSSTAHEMSNKLITQFLALLDGFDEKPGKALIVGATNRPEALDPTMIRSGRFDRRINFCLPSLDAREAILRATVPTEFPADLDVHRIAALTEGWCSADLRSLWTRAVQFAQSEHRSQILQLDCEVAIEKIAPLVHARRIQMASSA